MEFFRKLLGKSALCQETEQKIKDVKTEGKPFRQLGSNLIHAVCEAANDVKSFGTPEKLADPINEFWLRQEFLYFYFHLTHRLAHAQEFTRSERADLSDILYRVLDASLGEIPETYRSECREFAMHQSNAAEIDYASSKEIYPTEDPETLRDSVYAKFARKIEEKLGREHNPAIAFRIIDTTSQWLCETNIPNLLRELRSHLREHAEMTRSLPFQK